jgi:hypothetical protein
VRRMSPSNETKSARSRRLAKKATVFIAASFSATAVATNSGAIQKRGMQPARSGQQSSFLELKSPEIYKGSYTKIVPWNLTTQELWS